MYKDANYAHGRLTGTVVTHLTAGPVYVYDVQMGENYANTRSLKVGYYPITGLEEGWGDDLYRYHDNKMVDGLENFNLEPVRLGYVNNRYNCSYLSRIPLRRYWKQGLGTRNLKCLGRVPKFGDLSKTIEGVYPTLDESKSMLSNDGSIEEVAFSRCFSLGSNRSLFYKKLLVGDWENGLKLKDEFVEELEDRLNFIAAA